MIKILLRNISYSLGVNLFSLLSNTLVTFVLPIIVGIETYSHYQLLCFYISYIGYLQFGITDGVYLRLGGLYYNQLDKSRLKAEFIFVFLYSFLVMVSLFTLICSMDAGRTKMQVYYMAAGCTIIILPMLYLLNVLQGTNKIKEYSVALITRFVLWAVFIFVILIGKIDNIILISVGLVLSQCVTLFTAGFYCKDILFVKSVFDDFTFSNIRNDFKRGIHLTVSNLSGVLIIGIIMFGIEQNWDVITFGKIALAFSLANSFMIFIRSISQVLFPIMRRMNADALIVKYKYFKDVLSIFMVLGLSFYYSIKHILLIILPTYQISIEYMAILLPMILFESKRSLLIETYLKTFNHERLLTKINLVTVCFSLVSAVVVIGFYEWLEGAVFLITLVLCFQSVFSEYQLAKKIDISFVEDNCVLIFWSIAFIVCHWFIKSVWGAFMYFILLVVYVFCNREKIKALYNKI